MFDIIGQENAKVIFEKEYNKGRLSHAYIVTGPDGIGKSIFAMHMASVLLCSGGNKPCGVCDSCIKVRENVHPDLRIIAREGKSIGVQSDIRPLIEEIYKKPYEGNKKIIIIKNAGDITTQGQNAILKTLEEPPEYITIIMLTESLSRLLPTIQSRCQTVRLQTVPNELIRNYLVSAGIDSEKASAAASYSEGIPGNAFKFLDDRFMALRQDVISTARKIVRADENDILDYTNFFLGKKDNIDEILNIMLIWYRDVLTLKLAKDRNVLINSDFYDLLVEECGILSYNRLDRIITLIRDTQDKLRQNTNYQLTIEVMLLNIQEV